MSGTPEPMMLEAYAAIRNSLYAPDCPESHKDTLRMVLDRARRQYERPPFTHRDSLMRLWRLDLTGDDPVYRLVEG